MPHSNRLPLLNSKKSLNILAIIKGQNVKTSWIRIVQVFEKIDSQKFNITFKTYDELRMSDIISARLIVVQRMEEFDLHDFLTIAKSLGKKIIYEIDDNLLKLSQESAMAEKFPVVVKNVKSHIAQADYVVCSTEYLKNELSQFVDKDKINVIKNIIDTKTCLKEIKSINNQDVHNEEHITMVISNTDYFKLFHKENFINELNKILIEYGDKITLYFVGNSYLQDFTDNTNVKIIEELNYDDYINLLIKQRFDIAIVPLEETEFHKSKSNIKYLDFSIVKTACIFSKIIPYVYSIENEVNGILVDNTEKNAFYNAIKKLIDNPELRNKIAQNAFDDVIQNYDISYAVNEWEKLFNAVFNEKQDTQYTQNQVREIALEVINSVDNIRTNEMKKLVQKKDLIIQKKDKLIQKRDEELKQILSSDIFITANKMYSIASKTGLIYIAKAILIWKRHGLKYLIRKLAEKTSSKIRKRAKRASIPISNLQRYSQLNQKLNTNFKIAVHLHIIDPLSEIMLLLNNLKSKYDLFLTIEGEKNKSLYHNLTQINNTDNIEYFDGKGLEQKTFLNLLPRLKKNKYELVLKLTIKNETSDIEKARQNIMLNSLLGNISIVNTILNAFAEDSRIKIIGPEQLYSSVNVPDIEKNGVISNLLKTMKIDASTFIDKWGFFDGSMFWARIDTFNKFAESLQDNNLLDLQSDESTANETFNDAIKKITGLLPLINNTCIATIDLKQHDNPVINKNSKPSSDTADTIKKVLAEPGVNIAAANIDTFNKEQISAIVKINEATTDLEANLFDDERKYDYLEPDVIKRLIANYNIGKEFKKEYNHTDKSVVIYTAIAGNYEALKIPEFFDPRFSYVVFSDQPLPDTGLFKVRPIEYIHLDPTRSARFVKTHPHILLSDYDIAVWIDASILICDDIYHLIDEFIKSGKPVAAIPHPHRTTLREEADKCIKLGKDDADIISSQISAYKRDGFYCDNLIETGFMIFNLKDPALHKTMRFWWSEMEKGSKRDQISINYAIKKAETQHYLLMNKPYNSRNYPSLAFFRHEKDHNSLADIISSKTAPYLDPFSGEIFSQVKDERIAAQQGRNIDIVVCVHNALDDVKLCLESVDGSKSSANLTIIIIDDGSDEDTRSYLEEFANARKDVLLHRNKAAQGYTKAANKGMQLSAAELVIFLNSDTIVTNSWAEKMADAVFSREDLGLVGPMSNAASHQSIPDTKSTENQTAINKLPPGVSIEDMNRYCEEWTTCNTLPRVPLVHGFCFGVTRKVINSIGKFDDVSFPRGFGEENDYCFRAANQGFGLVIATHTYVYHAKSKSYNEKRTELAKKGANTLKQLYGLPRIQRSIESMENNPYLYKMRVLTRELYE